ncbi:hypothetical protein [Actinomyces howellii]|nr:hypothetical protein [Actinomyces howellii]
MLRRDLRGQRRASGHLGSATTTSTVDIPVAEVQTLNTTTED